MNTRTCTVDGCENKVQAKDLCNSHYARWRKHGDYNVTPKHNPLNTDTHKVCGTCRELLPRADYYRSSRTRDGLRASCKPCTNASNVNSYERNKEKVLERQRIARSTPEHQARLRKYLEHYLPANRDKYAERSAKRRALMRDALVDEGITVKALRAKHGDECMFCGVTMLFNGQAKGNLNPRLATIEHLQPLSRGGKHSWDNTTLCCHRCNTSKNNKTVDEFMQYMREAS